MAPPLPKITLHTEPSPGGDPSDPLVTYTMLHGQADDSAPGGVRIGLLTFTLIGVAESLPPGVGRTPPTVAGKIRAAADIADQHWRQLHDPDDPAHEAQRRQIPDHQPCLGCAPIPAKIDEAACSPAIVDRARARYEAYNANSGWLNYQGNRCPEWPALTSAVRSHWCATIVDDYR